MLRALCNSLKDLRAFGWQVAGLPRTVLSGELDEGSGDLSEVGDVGSEEIAETQPLSDFSRAGGWLGLGDAGQFVFSRSDPLRRELKSQVGYLWAAKYTLFQVHFYPMTRQSSQNLVQEVQVFWVIS